MSGAEPGDSSVKYPQFRLNVIEGLRILASRDAAEKWLAGEATYPSLTDGVHWLIDDTFWDVRPVADSVGILLLNTAEADAVAAAVDAVLSVVDSIGPDAPDEVHVRHEMWAKAQDACSKALSVLNT